ncbi:expressed unknown protein [Seminavis robusta]|uniref:Uncharacterized protein n=1 Tax=Seminavis robusta TaxID=568900 RepID=A0A9N8H3T0_9STRA|nr:expressed unknown protein [Seminavis robusta]|eukprot:Sro33_g021251.1  (170) ;mRNA; r:29547-30056
MASAAPSESSAAPSQSSAAPSMASAAPSESSAAPSMASAAPSESSASPSSSKGRRFLQASTSTRSSSTKSHRSIDQTSKRNSAPISSSPRAACDSKQQDMKCEQGSTRLAENRSTDLATCQQLCVQTDGCNYYSFAESGEHAGVCMGCGSTSNAVFHENFVFYPVGCSY